LSAHPLDGYKFEMDNYGFTPINALEDNRGRQIRIAGFVTDAGHMTTKKGDKFGKFTINDYTGHYEIMLWRNSYVQFANFLQNGQKLMLQGTYDEQRQRPGVMEFSIQSITLLEQVRKLFTKKIMLLIEMKTIDEVFVQFLEQNVKAYPGNTEIIIMVNDPETGFSARLKTHNTKIELNDDLLQFLQSKEDIRYQIDKI
ncbi:MAG: hypothetical protein EBZ77_16345, partial [Chitinophagia bacterium]|nr:hypothetical protein [Chitinophagia bacterium]